MITNGAASTLRCPPPETCGKIALRLGTLTPRIEDQWVCIATNAQVVLASVVSSCFGDEGVYFPVFEFPSVDAPYSPSSDFGRDGYIARIIGMRAAIGINNALARIQPKAILLLGLTETEMSYLRVYLPSEKLVEISTIEEFSKRVPFAKSKSDYIGCKSSQIIEGLLFAKFKRKRLVIDETAPPLPTRQLHGGESILLIENDRHVDDIAAINYAFAINADVVLVPPVDRQQIQSLPRQLHAWSNDKSHMVDPDVEREISKRIKGITFLQYRFATFFTSGVPYGLIIENVIPCSHVFKNWHCGVFIANSIIEEHNPVTFDSALLFSPQHFNSEETEDLTKILDDNNYTVKLLLGEDATVKQLDNYGAHFPFDVMHICAHGGETDGYYVIQDFADRQGNPHTLEFYEIVGFSPIGGGMVTVTSKAIFKTLDGFPWMSPPLKSFPKYVFEDMLKALQSRADDASAVRRIRINDPIALSCHIGCHDSIHQGHFDSLAGLGHPIVFNNTCASSYELAEAFIGAGARSYVGTLWNIENNTAIQAARTFYKEAVQHGNVLAAFFAMSKALAHEDYQNVYILWGLHFSSFRKPSKKSDARIFEALVRTYFMWLRKIATTADPEVKRNSLPIAKFLLAEIVKNFAKERLDKIGNFDSNVIEDHERSLPPPPEDAFSRGVTEMEVRSQVRAAGDELRGMPASFARN